jgi:hypothetical protein
MMALGLALHQGEELLIPLPFVMLVVAYLLMRWANSGKAASADEPEEPSSTSTQDQTTDYTTPTFD